jgi:flavin reductase (DIM6/NTAB) family NADH-FMN oxidoreductase RutF
MKDTARKRINSLEREQFRSAMRRAAQTIAIVTVGAQPDRKGFTATSYCSASDDPPTLLVCVNKNTSALPFLLSSSHFALNLLAHHHQLVADEFAGRSGKHGEERFVAFEWGRNCYEAPVLKGSLAGFVCRKERLYVHGDYAVVTGIVDSISLGLQSDPLIYLDGKYCRVQLGASSGLTPF